jgi:hypothetical protein
VVEDAIVVVYLVFLMLLVLGALIPESILLKKLGLPLPGSRLVVLVFLQIPPVKRRESGEFNDLLVHKFDTREHDVLKQFSPLATEEFGEPNILFLCGAHVSLKC